MKSRETRVKWQKVESTTLKEGSGYFLCSIHLRGNITVLGVTKW